MLETGIDKLGQFPILQFFGGLVIVCGVVYAIFRGERDKTRTPTPAEFPEQRLYFDGPIAKGLSLLEGAYRELKEIRNDNERWAAEAKERDREQIELLRQIGPRRR